jgi:dipeptidyl aminopeptidase/acylaminoacyl peptidase
MQTTGSTLCVLSIALLLTLLQLPMLPLIPLLLLLPANTTATTFTAAVSSDTATAVTTETSDATADNTATATPDIVATTATVTGDELSKMYACSPVLHAAAAQAPTLIALGAKDRRVPFSQGMEWYHSLKSRGISAKLLCYPEDVHAIGEYY